MTTGTQRRSRVDSRAWWRRFLTDETRRQQVVLAVTCLFALVAAAGTFITDFGAAVPVMFGGGAAAGVTAALRYDPFADSQPTLPSYLRTMTQGGRTVKDLTVALVLAYVVSWFAGPVHAAADGHVGENWTGPLMGLVYALFIVVGMLVGALAVVVVVWGSLTLVRGLRAGALGRNTAAASAALIISVIGTFACSLPAIRQTSTSSHAGNLGPLFFIDTGDIVHPVLLWVGRMFALLLVASFAWMWNAYYGFGRGARNTSRARRRGAARPR